MQVVIRLCQWQTFTVERLLVASCAFLKLAFAEGSIYGVAYLADVADCFEFTGTGVSSDLSEVGRVLREVMTS
jgi:hypothetical protein